MRGSDQLIDVDELYALAKEDPYHEEGEILGSMTTTPPPEALRLALHYMTKNYGDPLLFKSLSLLTQKLASLTRSLLRLPDYPLIVTSGGTESNIMALYVLGRGSGRKKVVAPDTIHHSVSKACDILGYTLATVETDERGRFSLDKLVESLGGRDSILVLTMGTTELGVVDDIGSVIDVLRDTETPLHIDAAFGGFTFPYTHPETYDSWMRKLVSQSITFTYSVDYHKFPGAPIPGGALVVPPQLRAKLDFPAPYMPMGSQTGLLGTRPGYTLASSLATLNHYGMDGLGRLAKEKYADALWFSSEAVKLDSRLYTVKPMVPISCIRVKGDLNADRLIDYLWGRRLYVYGCGRYNGLRVVHMPHVSRKSLYKLLEALKDFLG